MHFDVNYISENVLNYEICFFLSLEISMLGCKNE